jgi:hypothetical protein
MNLSRPGDNAVMRAVLLINPARDFERATARCYSDEGPEWDGRELELALRSAIATIGPDVYRGLGDRLKEAKEIGRLNANCLCIEAKCIGDGATFAQLVTDFTGVLISFASKVNSMSESHSRFYNLPTASVETSKYILKLSLARSAGKSLNIFGERSVAVARRSSDEVTSITGRAAKVELALADRQGALVTEFQAFLDELHADGQFGGTESSRAVCRTVNQLAIRFGLEVTCWDDKQGSWVPVRLRYSTPRGRGRPGYFQAGKPGFTAGFVYSGKHWPKLKAAARQMTEDAGLQTSQM